MAPDELSAEPVVLSVDAEHGGKRLDVFLAEQFPRYSRVQWRKVIHANGVQVEGRTVRPAFRLHPGQQVAVRLPELPRLGPRPEDIPINVLYEDDHLVAVNKPANMVVHPAKGHWSGTLTSALAFHFDQLSSIGGPTRPGVVHRLDRETSGVIVVAKTDFAHMALAGQFESRTTEKEYVAIVAGAPDHDRDIIDQPIGMHPFQREKMAIRRHYATSRPAHTFYEVVRRFRGYAVLRVEPKTGRTHQIRVHLAHINCPVLCDRMYGGRSTITAGELAGTADDTVLLARHALHARRLRLKHPATGKVIQFEAPLPPDMRCVLESLEQHRG